ncbi:type II toxin-antitoxin system prevent-host-death family antitoxin [Sinomonas atrocyanea]|jgi:prevent-host-death family protein|uniref:type II toxin-antitoxin system prevent-host-death family antitoxin n=1 Tax=Sinomonas atrocyanea TaxID=37927 RepID=UPI0027850A5A|nr:type II toxin-antitoxin system prevent-host-death family antitoxin [Sinomonas atrocyanea]MDQ0261918.1 prevent-host-death family protein [Sinomonas atrocyanea]MDR6623682.1 prevent-host-death family protein [Sinomonas atrocyanea]
MAEMSISEAGANLGAMVDASRTARAPIFLSRRGVHVAAVIGADELRLLLEAAEELEDIRAAEAAEAGLEAGTIPIPWDAAKDDLGLA